ncbi:MAG: hypothetical protein ACRBEE_03760 [Arenicella sp.]
MKIQIILSMVFALLSLDVTARSYYYYYDDGYSYSTYRYTKIKSPEERDSGKTKIKKCQDKDGKWHYGTNSDYRCADSSKITTLNKNGVRVKEVNAVKTQEELDAEKKAREEAKLNREKEEFEKIERDRILTVYQSEEDIERARVEKLESLKRKIEQHGTYLKALESNEKSLANKKKNTSNKALKAQYSKRIDELKPKAEASKKRVAELEKEKETVNEKYDNDLEVFKKYKS